MIIRSLSARATLFTQRRGHRRRWSALPAWVRQESHRSRVMRDRVEASRDRHIRSFLGDRSGPRF
jgi:hypothetical protein